MAAKRKVTVLGAGPLTAKLADELRKLGYTVEVMPDAPRPESPFRHLTPRELVADLNAHYDHVLEKHHGLENPEDDGQWEEP